MKLSFSLAIATILCITFSCNMDDNDFSQENLHGTWELSSYWEESELFIVQAYEFNDDGTFENRVTARQQDSNIDLGYNSITNGTYSLVGNKLSLQEIEFLTLPQESTVWYTSSDKLVGSDWNRETEITISLQKRKSQLVLDFGPCPPNAQCTGPITFFRR